MPVIIHVRHLICHQLNLTRTQSISFAVSVKRDDVNNNWCNSALIDCLWHDIEFESAQYKQLLARECNFSNNSRITTNNILIDDSAWQAIVEFLRANDTIESMISHLVDDHETQLRHHTATTTTL